MNSTEAASRGNKELLIAALAALLTIVCFLPALQNGFVDWDDGDYVYDNPYLRSSVTDFLKWAFFDFHAENWHPLTWISHALDYSLWGLNPLGHHLTNILLHGLNTFLVVLLAARLYRGASGLEDDRRSQPEGRFLSTGLITGLLFGLHPIHVESVAWISERKDLLCAFFFLISLLAYVRYTAAYRGGGQPVLPLRNRHYLLSLVSFGLALLSKPMAVTLPFVLLILDWYPAGRLKGLQRLRLALAEKIPFIMMSIGSVVLTLAAQHKAIRPLEIYPLSGRILVGVKALFSYLVKMIWPAGLSPYYPYPAQVSFFSSTYGIPVLLLIAVTACSIIYAKRWKTLPAAWAYYIITLLPVLGIIQVGSQAMADRYTYLPSIAPLLLAGLGTTLVLQKASAALSLKMPVRAAALAGGLIVGGLLSYATIRQVRIWENTITLWSRVIEVSPDFAKAYDNRGATYGGFGRYDEAILDFTRAIEISPKFWRAYYNRGLAFFMKGQDAEALKDFTRAIDLNAAYSETYLYRGKTYERLGFPEEARQDHAQAVRLNTHMGSGMH